jgi:hypothetical protein
LSIRLSLKVFLNDPAVMRWPARKINTQGRDLFRDKRRANKKAPRKRDAFHQIGRQVDQVA